MSKRRSRETPKPIVKGEKPDPGFEKEPPPEATNRDHVAPVGSRHAVPGAGVVSSGADAGPVEDDTDLEVPHAHPGHGRGPLNAPGATRPGTTRSGVSSVPSGDWQPGGSESTSVPVEEITDGGEAPLSVPTDSVGPQPGAPDVPELYDPNYTAASHRHARNGEHPKRTLTPEARVADLMSQDLDCCTPETNIQYVASMMADKDVGSIPVVDDTDRMVPIGIITDRDIAIRVVAKGEDLAGLRADQCMTGNVRTIPEHAPLIEAVLLMERLQVRRLPVVDRGGRLIGMLATADIALLAPPNLTARLIRRISEPPGNG